MRILAFEFGSRTGWASSRDQAIESGVQEFPVQRGESAGMRFIRFNAWLREMLTLALPELVVYEQAHHRGGHATELLVGMATRTQEACAERKIEYAAVHSATLKKSMAGSGRADKAAMMKAASKLFPGRTLSGDDEADALLLLVYAQGRFDGGSR